MTETQVAVVGGGLAGLNAARLLQRSGIDFTVFEARGRPGGRILTVDDGGQPSDDGFDLGPSWFWPEMQPAIATLVSELGLAAFTQHSEGDVVFERMSREAPHRLPGIRQEPQSTRLAGGSAALVQALVGRFPSHRLCLDASVTAMRLTEQGVELSIRSAGGLQEQVTADGVIAALPPRLLAATVRFTPLLDAGTLARWQATPTWMAPHAKFFAVYERAFWRNVGLSGTAQSMLGPMVEMHDATTASGHPALFGFMGIGADQRAAIGEQKLVHACLDQLARIFGAEARTPRATLFKDWAADPLTATAADRLGGDHPIAGTDPWVPDAWRARLVMAGSETSATEPGYLAGAVAASERAVAEIRQFWNGSAAVG